ncbi:MAG: hypothetical protein DRO39_02860 [Thermoprotei archaeon]|nr:MAG: hypothetical protein DRO39_02860 [Thermoprotei archaeon]
MECTRGSVQGREGGWMLYKGSDILADLYRALVSKGFRVVAPVRRGWAHILAPVDNPEEIDLDFVRTVNSPKHFLYPPSEPVFTWRRRSGELVFEEPFQDPPEPIAFLGIKPCDANAIALLDEVLIRWGGDPYYASRRSRSFAAVFDCRRWDRYCFCESLGYRVPIVGSYDIWVVEDDGEVFLRASTSKGGEVLGMLNTAPAPHPPRIRRLGTDRLGKELIDRLARFYESDRWREVSRRCLLCGGCTSSCPTCTCFDTRDDPLPDLSQGIRMRLWTSCVLRSFTMVAGGRVVRRSREERFKFRYFHKLVFSKERLGRYLCVGCGRCSAQCPAGIDMVEVVRSVAG